MPWTLDDAEQRAAEAPSSFFIPPAERRHSLERGDVVKLIFRLERGDGEVGVERMWVELVETEPYVGLLRNDPRLGGVIEFGERVEFGPEHVCAYAYSQEELGYDPDTPCFLLKRVAEADAPPARLLVDAEGDWQAHAADETDEELSDASQILHWTVSYLTDRFPATAEAIRGGGGEWHWSGSRYERAD